LYSLTDTLVSGLKSDQVSNCVKRPLNLFAAGDKI